MTTSASKVLKNIAFYCLFLRLERIQIRGGRVTMKECLCFYLVLYSRCTHPDLHDYILHRRQKGYRSCMGPSAVVGQYNGDACVDKVSVPRNEPQLLHSLALDHEPWTTSKRCEGCWRSGQRHVRRCHTLPAPGQMGSTLLLCATSSSALMLTRGTARHTCMSDCAAASAISKCPTAATCCSFSCRGECLRIVWHPRHPRHLRVYT